MRIKRPRHAGPGAFAFFQWRGECAGIWKGVVAIPSWKLRGFQEGDLCLEPPGQPLNTLHMLRLVPVPKPRLGGPGLPRHHLLVLGVVHHGYAPPNARLAVHEPPRE